MCFTEKAERPKHLSIRQAPKHLSISNNAITIDLHTQHEAVLCIGILIPTSWTSYARRDERKQEVML